MNHYEKILKKTKSKAPLNQASIRSLIDLGTIGHYPLFYNEWLEKYRNIAHTLQQSDQHRNFSQEIIQRLSKHKSLERKRTVLLSLNEDQLMIFINEFFSLVETRMLDKKPGFH